jgi:hypothetical protein
MNVMTSPVNLPAAGAPILALAAAALANLDWRPLVPEDGLDLGCFPLGAQVADDGDLTFVRFRADAEHHRDAKIGDLVVEVMDWSRDDLGSDDSYLGVVVMSEDRS